MTVWTVASGVCAAMAVLVLMPAPTRQPPRTGLLLAGGALVVAALAVRFSRWAVPVAVVLLSAYAVRLLWRARLRAVEAAATAESVLDLCESMIGDLRVGHPPGLALTRAAAQWPVVESVAVADRVGASVPGAFRVLSAAPGAGDLRLVGAAWEVSHRTGHGLASALTQVRESLREDRATARVVGAELASARATARLVACLPVAALLMGSGAGGDPLGFLFGTVVGWGCLAGGLALGLLGLAWIEAIARRVLDGGQ